MPTTSSPSRSAEAGAEPNDGDRGAPPARRAERSDPMPKNEKTPRPERVEALLDEMIKETFPASDAPQLDGVLDAGPAANAVPSHPLEHAPPPDVAPPGDDAALDVREGRYPVGDAGAAYVRTDADGVEIELPANPLRIGASALEDLIAALQKHRPPLHRGR
jgi:hypothetical protein